MIEKLNLILQKTRFAITEHIDMADIMVGQTDYYSYSLWLKKLSENNKKLLIQSKHKRLFLVFNNEVFEMYVQHLLPKIDYFELIEICKVPFFVSLDDVEDYSFKRLDSYYGISAAVNALSICSDTTSIFQIEIPHPPNIHKSIAQHFSENIQIIEERKDYLYFLLKGKYFEAKELVGIFDVYTGNKKIASASNKDDAIRSAIAWCINEF
jgi:hypothetical protein